AQLGGRHVRAVSERWLPLRQQLVHLLVHLHDVPVFGDGSFKKRIPCELPDRNLNSATGPRPLTASVRLRLERPLASSIWLARWWTRSRLSLFARGPRSATNARFGCPLRGWPSSRVEARLPCRSRVAPRRHDPGRAAPARG